MPVPRLEVCAFCGQSGKKLTDEDYIPKWMDRRYEREPSEWGIVMDGEEIPQRPRVGMSRKARKLPCAACNNGWMSRLQVAAKPVVTALLESDRPSTLSPEAQLILVQWMTMTSMVHEWEHDSSHEPVYTSAERRAFAETQKPPTFSRLLLSAREHWHDDKLMRLRGTRLRGYTGRPDERPTPEQLEVRGRAFIFIAERAVMALLFVRKQPNFRASWFLDALTEPVLATGQVAAARTQPVLHWPPARPIERPVLDALWNVSGMGSL